MSASQPTADQNFVMVPPDPATGSVERLRRQALRLLTEAKDDADDQGRREAGTSAEAARESAAATPAASVIASVIAMPAAFLVVVFVAIALFGEPGAQRSAAAPETLTQPAAARAASPIFASAEKDIRGVIPLAEDARIASIALDGDRVALSIESPAGREILVYDFRAGRRIGGAQIETVRADAVDTLSMLTGPPPAAPQVAAPAPERVLAVEPRLKPRTTP